MQRYPPSRKCRTISGCGFSSSRHNQPLVSSREKNKSVRNKKKQRKKKKPPPPLPPGGVKDCHTRFKARTNGGRPRALSAPVVSVVPVFAHRRSSGWGAQVISLPMLVNRGTVHATGSGDHVLVPCGPVGSLFFFKSGDWRFTCGIGTGIRRPKMASG
jgi:hypothetical protein